MNNFILHKAQSRGFADHGWLQTNHTFSFANYYDPERLRFGMLRVLNDDTIAGGEGFGMHPHDNMEIITIPLEGDLEHKDSMGNTSVIKSGDIQVMSAGTGIHHSEFNHNSDMPVSLLQIWVFADKKNVEPRYQQISLNTADRHNKFQQILSPNHEDEGVWIHQQAWFSMGRFDKGSLTNYEMHNKENGVYFFVIYGELNINNTILSSRDGLGIWEIDQYKIEVLEDTEILVMEVPMK